VEVEVTRGA